MFVSSAVLIFIPPGKVSRRYYHLTHYRPIWVNAYARCPFLLPPGPFSYQSAVDLERTLKKSHLLEANWTSPYPCPVSRQTFAIPVGGDYSMKLVGRYLLIAGDPTRMFRCYDLESKNDEFAPIAVYDFTDSCFDCVVEDSNEFQVLCALRNQPRGAQRGTM
jgi:hypothetical protein